jgi:very-short-patch-repair endonuclease
MPTPDPKIVRQRLEQARRELIDLGLRNRLINYRSSRARGVEIPSSDLASIFQAFVIDEKRACFLSRSDPALFDSSAGPPAPAVDAGAERNRTILELPTTESPASLAKRLLKTHRDARLVIEEQGCNLLFLAFGMLEWYEADAAREAHRAPLILVPVVIEETAGNRFHVRYDGTGVSGNPSLAAKLRAESQITLPEVSEPEEAVDVDGYFESVRLAVAEQERWRVDTTVVVLGFFSFAKYRMYKDLEGDEWPDDRKPWAHDVLGCILDCGFDEPQLAIAEDESLDKHRPVEDIHEVCDADSSQVLALLQARTGSTMVIEGPPGTGKSQTITNLIADAIMAGRNVLFVAEKAQAVNVVLDNLNRAGLRDACLYLHGTKTSKKDFYVDLGATLGLDKPRLRDLQAQLQELTARRDTLNAYCNAVNQVLPERGMSPIKAMGRLTQLGSEHEDMRRPDFALMQGWTQTDFERRLGLVERIQTCVREHGAPANNPFYGSESRVLLPDDKTLVRERIRAAGDAFDTYVARVSQLATVLGWPSPDATPSVETMLSVADEVVKAPPHAGVRVSAPEWLTREADVREALERGRRRADLRERFSGLLRTSAWTTDVEREAKDFEHYGQKWWRMFNGDYRRARRRLKSLCLARCHRTYRRRLEVFGAIRESQACERTIERAGDVCGNLLGCHWQGVDSDWQALACMADWAAGLRRTVQDGRLPLAVLTLLEQEHDREGVGSEADKTRTAAGVSAAALDSLAQVLLLRDGDKKLRQQGFDAQRATLAQWLEHLDDIQALVAFNLLKDEAQERGLQAVADDAVEWDRAGERLVASFEQTWYSGVLREAFQARPALARFTRLDHEAAIRASRDLDRAVLATNQAKIALKHHDGIPHYAAAGGLGVLRREVQKRTRHLSIRKVMEVAGEAIQDIKPVFMMSPLSVAMHLPPDGPQFDVVIFDEASQVKPADAFGAIIRGHQTIVVGDTKQLPPTSFFDKLTQTDADDEDEDESPIANVTQGMESILGVMSALTPDQSARHADLRWHYRSRHHSLIALSNRLFYKNRLYVFHSPDSRPPDMGLVFHHYPETVYGRGTTRRNPEEARLVAQAVVRHARETPGLSLLVATFNRPQKEAIEDELDRLRADEPALREFERLHPQGKEPLDVRNLETVQGDERDVVFISVGFGRDEHRRVTNEFGPVNNDGGERRLNVLFTRARVRCEVFSNIKADDIAGDARSPDGVRKLKAFLHYAETGELDQPMATEREPQSEFELAVLAAVRASGYDAVPQVGSAGFFVDIGVCDPGNPNRFVLGVECDGAPYHSARSARDRDRLREQVLMDRGWRIHRVWSTDWFRNPAPALRRLQEAVAQAVAAEGSAPAAAGPPPEVGVERIPVPDRAPPTPPYTLVRLDVNLNGVELRDVDASTIAKWVREVVKVESPVHFDEVVRRIREAAGLASAREATRDAVWRGVRRVIMEGQVLYDGPDSPFLWRNPRHDPLVRDRSAFPDHFRTLATIHPAELKASLLQAVRLSYGLRPEEASSVALRSLGFERPTDQLRDIMNAYVRGLLDTSELCLRGDMLRIA